MSDLKTQSNTIVINNKEYGLRFTINAIDEIQDHFDKPIAELSEILQDQRKIFANLRYLITVLINEDIDIQNDNGASLPHINEKYIGRYITPANFNILSSAILKSFSNGMPENTEDDIPNAMSE